MTAYDLLVCGDVLTPDGLLRDGWVAVTGEIVAAVGVGPRPEAKQIHEARGGTILPGFVDGQTHAGSYKGLEGIAPTTRSAVAGGITTIVDMPYDNPDPLNTVARLAAKNEAIERLAYGDVALYGTLAKGQGVDAIEALMEGGICALKISSFESHPVRFPRIGNDQTLDILEAVATKNLPVGLHNEDQEIVRSRIAGLAAQGKTTPEWHVPSRPVAAELAATAAFLELGAATGAHVHLVHLSTPRGYALVEQYREKGFRATAELCIHYLCFDAAADMARLGARMKVNPPIRADVRDGLWDAVTHGKVEFISSDHSSWPVTNKLVPSIFDAGAGIPGLETLAPALFRGLRGRVDDPLAVLAAQLSERPARFFGLWPRKGVIRPGADADLVVFEPTEWRFDASQTHDGLNWSPFDGETFPGRAAATYVRGKLVWDGKTVVGPQGHGRFIRRNFSTGP